ncbi:MAG: molybdate ABC transporter substrate-binding protein [Candidatus Latescibacteria bacterium]|nr:molybdate ABC transporter substrate-binding protein [Candidatus Latescibacterota bacterium]
MRSLRGMALALVLALCPTLATAQPVNVYAAASLTDVLQDLVQRFKASGQGELNLVPGGTSSLAKQIENGAPADLFFSANVEWMTHLDSLGLIEKETCAKLLGNTLVVVAPAAESFAVEARKGFDFAGAFKGRLAIADPGHVPAGLYTRQAFEWLGWWAGVQDRLAPAADVRAALVYVERGECAAGVVYATDVARSDKVKVLATLPAESHAPIVYPVAIVKGHRTDKAVEALAFLQSTEAAKVYAQYGFVVLKKAALPAAGETH